jgi:hypothetical protein
VCARGGDAPDAVVGFVAALSKRSGVQAKRRGAGADRCSRRPLESSEAISCVVNAPLAKSCREPITTVPARFGATHRLFVPTQFSLPRRFLACRRPLHRTSRRSAIRARSGWTCPTAWAREAGCLLTGLGGRQCARSALRVISARSPRPPLGTIRNDEALCCQGAARIQSGREHEMGRRTLANPSEGCPAGRIRGRARMVFSEERTERLTSGPALGPRSGRYSASGAIGSRPPICFWA